MKEHKCSETRDNTQSAKYRLPWIGWPHVRARGLPLLISVVAFVFTTGLPFAQYQVPRITVRLNGTLAADGDVGLFQISPDSKRVFYMAEQDTAGATELYSVPINGGQDIRLNVALPTGSAALPLGFTADSQRVVFVAPQETTDLPEIFSVPAEGPANAAIKLNGPLTPGGGVYLGQPTPDSSRVVYLADQLSGGPLDFYSVPIDGPTGTGVRLAGPVNPLGLYGRTHDISPDSRRFVYVSENTPGMPLELYSVPIEGPDTAGVKLNTAVVPGGQVKTFRISPDSTRVVYTGDILTQGVDELFSVPIDGPLANSVKLNVPVAAGGDGVAYFAITPDSRRVVYTFAPTSSSETELYSVRIEGPADESAILNPTLAPGGSVRSVVISPDSRRVVYRAGQDSADVLEIFSVVIEGPSSLGKKLNFPLGADGDVKEIKITPDSRRVVYIADPWSFSVDDRFHLYSVSIDGPGESSTMLNKPLPLLGDVVSFLIVPDGSRVIYCADQDTDDMFELYEVPIGGPNWLGEKISGGLVADGDVVSTFFNVSPDSRHVVYLADKRTDEVYELFSTGLRPAGAPHWEMYE